MQNLTLNNKNYELQSTTGKVLSSGKNMETKVSGGGGGGYSNRGTGYTAPVSITSKTTIHDQFFLEDANGKEHAFQLSDFNLACRDGNILTVVAAINVKKHKGPYISVINHSTDKVYFDPIALKSICEPNRLIYILVLIAFAVITIKSTSAEAGIMLTILAAVGAAIYYKSTLDKNTKTVKNLIKPAEYFQLAS